MSTIKFVCPCCKKNLALKPALAGKKVACSCGQKILVPQAEVKAHWYYSIDDKRHGPVSDKDLKQLAEKLIVTPKHLVRKEGALWVEAKNVKGLFSEEALTKFADSSMRLETARLTQATDTKYCHNCAAPIFHEADICTRCGVRQHEVEEETPRGLPRWAWLAAGVMVILFIGLGAMIGVREMAWK
jgi:hypothetical protein